MAYKYVPVAQSESLAELGEAVDRELKRIEEALSGNQRLPTNSVEPQKPRGGDIVYADGTNWDPGGGEGLYIFGSSGWTKLETGSFQPLNSNLTEIANLTTNAYGRALLTLANQAALLAAIGAATTSQQGVVELATAAEVWAATAGKIIDAGLLSSAAAAVTLTDGATIAVNWISGVSFEVTLAGDRLLLDPTNEIANTFRTILVKGSDATPRTLTFDSEYLGEVPVLEDITSTVWYRLYLDCIGSSHFAVSAKKVLG